MVLGMTGNDSGTGKGLAATGFLSLEKMIPTILHLYTLRFFHFGDRQREKTGRI